MKVLIYDVDRGMKSIGDDSRIQEVFGYKPRRFSDTSKFNKFFKETHTLRTVKTRDELGESEEEIFQINDKDISIEIVDSISQYQELKKREVRGEMKKITLPQWGEIGIDVQEFITNFGKTDTHVIILGHTKTEKDEQLGSFIHKASLSGAMGEEIGRYFDLVMFTVTVKDEDTGETKYYWQVLPDESRPAKCRIKEVNEIARSSQGLIPQNYMTIFQFADRYPALKILVLGRPGSGKTYSLRTLKKFVNP